jgi:hypothetical protein
MSNAEFNEREFQSELDEANAKPEWLKEMTVLSVKPGDIVVLLTDGCTTEAEQDRLKDWMREALPHNRVMILEHGVKIGVLSLNEVTK